MNLSLLCQWAALDGQFVEIIIIHSTARGRTCYSWNPRESKLLPAHGFFTEKPRFARNAFASACEHCSGCDGRCPSCSLAFEDPLESWNRQKNYGNVTTAFAISKFGSSWPEAAKRRTKWIAEKLSFLSFCRLK